MKRNLNLGEMYYHVMSDDVLREKYSIACNDAGLKFNSELHGGCRIGKKKVGIQKFSLKQRYIAANIYRDSLQNS